MTKQPNIAIDPAFKSDESGNYLFGIAEKDGKPGELIPVSITQFNNYDKITTVPFIRKNCNSSDRILFISMLLISLGMIAFGVILWLNNPI